MHDLPALICKQRIVAQIDLLVEPREYPFRLEVLRHDLTTPDSWWAISSWYLGAHVLTRMRLGSWVSVDDWIPTGLSCEVSDGRARH